MLNLENVAEYDSAAEWCAQRGLKGKPGDLLPPFLSVDCFEAIKEDEDAFMIRVRECAYAIAMNRHAPRDADKQPKGFREYPEDYFDPEELRDSDSYRDWVNREANDQP